MLQALILMNKSYQIIDNFLDVEDFKKIHTLFYSENFPWFYHHDVANANENSQSYYFTHLFYWNFEITSKYFQELTPLIKKIQPNAFMRIKGNLYPNVNKFIVHEAHTDFSTPHKGAIFYLNSNNGKTILDGNIEIDSVSNRILFFDPSTLHQSTNCTDKKCRININLNYF